MAIGDLGGGFLTSDEIDNLFTGSPSDDEPVAEEVQEESKEEKKGKKEKDTVENQSKEIDTENLFSDGSESVDGGKDEDDTEDAVTLRKADSPFYTSIASAFVTDGIFRNLSDDDVKSIKTSDDFGIALDREIDSRVEERLDDVNKRIKQAMDSGMQLTEVQRHERILQQLDTFDDKITGGNQEAEDLRKQIIYQDFINRGFSEERANREVQKAISGGSDLEDAKAALQSLKGYWKDSYDDAVKEAKEETEAQQKKIKERNEALKKSILEDKGFLADFGVDASTRKRIYDSIVKPAARDENGNVLTELQKYRKDNPDDYLTKVGMLYVLTDGFKDFGKILEKNVKKGIRKGLSSLEKEINSTSRNSWGNLNYMSGSNDPESSSGFILDL